MHIGVSTQDFIGWGGGVGFIENLLFGLLAVPEQVTKITVFVPEKPGPMSNLVARVKRAVFEPSNAAQHLFGRTPSQEAWKMAPTLFARICPNVVAFDGSATTLSHLCQRLRVDILLPITKPSRNYGVPWVGYLADCQHRHYPKFFSAHEIAFRDRYFSNMLSDANVVIVNSRDAAADLDSFFPEGGAKIFALPFAPLLRSDNICNIISRTPLVKHKYATGDKYPDPFFIFYVNNRPHRSQSPTLDNKDCNGLYGNPDWAIWDAPHISFPTTAQLGRNPFYLSFWDEDLLTNVPMGETKEVTFFMLVQNYPKTQITMKSKPDDTGVCAIVDYTYVF